jgi:ferric-dicitrate binding protein FerR (iron transport regulator)
MPATSQPTDQPYGQLITDKQALEKIFRAHYARLVVDAKGRLGADAAANAPRVVSKAFHLAWQDRKRFQSMEELDAFLGANIHHGAARELSRIAGLHRMDKTGGQKSKHDVAEMSVDEAWERLEHTLEGGAPEAYRKRASTARHEAAEHVAALAKERNWKPMIGLTALGVLVAIGAIFWINKAGESRAVERALADPQARKTVTGAGQQADVTLDDGTVVRLGPETELTVPKLFGMTDGMRAVKIDGIASFNVTRTGEKAFEVRSGGVAMTATGTVFTVKRSREDSSVILNVRDGTVEMRVGEQTRSVTKGLSFHVNSAGVVSVPAAEQLSEATTWVDGTLTIQGRTLRYVLPQLKKWYGLDVHVQDIPLLQRTVFLSAPLNSPKEALNSIEKSGGLKFTYIGENMAFTDTTPSRPARRGR